MSPFIRHLPSAPAPMVALTGKFNVASVCHSLDSAKGPDGQPTHDGQHVIATTFAPTGSITSKSGLGSVGTTPSNEAITPSLGATTVFGGVLYAHTLQARVNEKVELTVLQEVSSLVTEAATTCLQRCNAPVAAEDVSFCGLHTQHPEWTAGCSTRACSAPQAPTQLTKSETGATQSATRQLQADRTNRFRYPILDLSLWAGGGASQFTYFQQTAAATATTLAAYSSTTNWQRTWGRPSR